MAVRSLARALAPGLTLVLLSAGCGAGSAPSVQLPAKPAAAATIPSRGAAGARPSTRSLVLAAYQSYWQAYGQAARARNLATARKLLRTYAQPSFVNEITAPLPRLWAAHQAGYGYAIPHVLSVTPKGTSALLHDCLDLSHLGTQDVRTGRVLPGSYGLPTVNFYVTLTRTGARWVVSKMQQVEVPCTP